MKNVTHENVTNKNPFMLQKVSLYRSSRECESAKARFFNDGMNWQRTRDNWARPYLDAEYAEDDEERAADEDDVADGTQRRQQRLYDQLQTARPTNDAVTINIILHRSAVLQPSPMN